MYLLTELEDTLTRFALYKIQEKDRKILRTKGWIKLQYNTILTIFPHIIEIVIFC